MRVSWLNVIGSAYVIAVVPTVQYGRRLSVQYGILTGPAANSYARNVVRCRMGVLCIVVVAVFCLRAAYFFFLCDDYGPESATSWQFETLNCVILELLPSLLLLFITGRQQQHGGAQSNPRSNHDAEHERVGGREHRPLIVASKISPTPYHHRP